MWLWPGSKLLVWGLRQSLLLRSIVIGLHPWAICGKKGVFLKFLFELEVQGKLELGVRTPIEVLATCSGTSFIFIFHFLVWFEEKRRKIAFYSLTSTVLSFALKYKGIRSV